MRRTRSCVKTCAAVKLEFLSRCALTSVVVVTLAIAMHKFWAGLALGFKLAQASESGTALRHALISAEGTEAGYPAAPLDCPAPSAWPHAFCIHSIHD